MAKIKNTQSEDVNIELKTLIMDPEGKMVAIKKTGSQKIISQGELEISQKLNVTNPEFWGLESPKLYQAISEVYQGGKLVDSYDTPFGIRYFNFDPVNGFFLNGESVKLKGVNLHHDLGPLGTAVNKLSLIHI